MTQLSTWRAFAPKANFGLPLSQSIKLIGFYINQSLRRKIMKVFRNAKTIVLSLVVFSLAFGSYFTASGAGTDFLQVTGTVTRGGQPVGEGYEVTITNLNKTQYTKTVQTVADPSGFYSWGFLAIQGVCAETDDVIEVVATDPNTQETVTNTETYPDAVVTSMTIDVDFPGNEGQIVLETGGPPTWEYKLVHISGELTQWKYIGAGITGADVAVGSTAETGGWGVISQTATEVVFETSTAMTSGEVTGFEISGPVVGMGDWVCHDSSGTVEGPLPAIMSGFTAYYNAQKSAVTLKWSTVSEVNNLGFDVYRSESPDGKFVKISPAYIKGAGTDSTPHDYQFADERAVVGKTYYYYLETISFSGERERTNIIKVIIDASGKTRVTGLMQPEKPALLQNFPNPFNPETWIPFHLADDADVTIRIFDIRGKQIRTIHLGQISAGYYETRGNAAFWDGRDSYGQEVSSGIYFYNLTAGTFSATKKLTIIK
jgi:hypothetical protein